MVYSELNIFSPCNPSHIICHKRVHKLRETKQNRTLLSLFGVGKGERAIWTSLTLVMPSRPTQIL